ncbi:hypothetical protein KFL_001810050 [Klebsormidium nitens]|uniref:tRNA pseudouridine(55) synthase n=1 Tax=Klebsormidium nitens TaxID=105231 RepID=A0A1Y1HZY6_KLENI|nr:hypothetical protein KFL_001810050 [Klebsormidium nitens]|eukprot:GAQ84224.1 hypothetical protein KFL_001810050 [Klebsormidium nitens]
MASTSCFRPQALSLGKADLLGAKVLDIELGEPLSGRMQAVRRLLTKTRRLAHLSLPCRLRAESFSGSTARAAHKAPTASTALNVSEDTSPAPSKQLSAAERRRRRKLADGDFSDESARPASPYSEPRQEDSSATTSASPQVASISDSGTSERERQNKIGQFSRAVARDAVASGARQERPAYRNRESSPLGELGRNGGVESGAHPVRRQFTAGEARARQFSDAVRFLNKDTGRPAPPRKPLVQPVIVSRGVLPDLWEGPNGTAILVDKPLEWSSHQACQRLKFQLKLKKIGHAGTLDPMASGLLILVAGPATKLMEVYQAQTKKYSGTIRLGETTPSLDIETEVEERFPWEHVTDDVIASTPESFLGDIMQVPPIYSALQVGGERLYKKARRGETMEIAARPITIEGLRLWRDEEVRQHVHFEVVCSKGTYVRSLARDIGASMGTGAYLVALRREAIGDFDVKDAWDIDDLLAQWQVRQDEIRDSRIFRSDALRTSEEPPTLSV